MKILAIGGRYSSNTVRLMALNTLLAARQWGQSNFLDMYVRQLDAVHGQLSFIARRMNRIGVAVEFYAAIFRRYKIESEQISSRIGSIARLLEQDNLLRTQIPATYPPVPLEVNNPELAKRIKRRTAELEAAVAELREVKKSFRHDAALQAAQEEFQPFPVATGLRDPRNEAVLDKRIRKALRAQQVIGAGTQNVLIEGLGYVPYFGTPATLGSLAGLYAMKKLIERRVNAGDAGAQMELDDINHNLIEAIALSAISALGGKALGSALKSTLRKQIATAAAAVLTKAAAIAYEKHLDERDLLMNEPFFIPDNPLNHAAREQIIRTGSAEMQKLEKLAYSGAKSEINSLRSSYGGTLVDIRYNNSGQLVFSWQSNPVGLV